MKVDIVHPFMRVGSRRNRLVRFDTPVAHAQEQQERPPKKVGNLVQCVRSIPIVSRGIFTQGSIVKVQSELNMSRRRFR